MLHPYSKIQNTGFQEESLFCKQRVSGSNPLVG